MMRRRLPAALAAALSFVAFTCGVDASQLHSPSTATLGSGKIQHVIVMVQENRTIDNLFAGFPGADTVSYGYSNGVRKALIPLPLQYGLDPDHTHAGFVSDFAANNLDGFDHEYVHKPCYSAHPQCTAYAYVQPSDSKIYFDLAKHFALADHVMQMNSGPSFANHVYLVAAQGGYPFAVAGNGNPGIKGPGCMSPADSSVPGVDMRIPFPGAPNRPIPACLHLMTIFDLLDAQGIGWRYYTPSLTLLRSTELGLWTPPVYINALYTRDLDHIATPQTSILNDIALGALAPVSYTTPTWTASDHPHASAPGEDPQAGPHWVNSVVNAVEASATYRDNTVIFVTWDDWGGWYDHYRPHGLNPDAFGFGISANEYGFRTPLLVISPYVINRVDHTERSQASIIHFIEAVFGLPSLGQLDARTDDLGSMFDFTATPRIVGSVAHGVPARRCGHYVSDASQSAKRCRASCGPGDASG